MAAISPPPRRARDTWWLVGMGLGTALGTAGCYLIAHFI
jgi:hypothetical protein